MYKIIQVIFLLDCIIIENVVNPSTSAIFMDDQSKIKNYWKLLFFIIICYYLCETNTLGLYNVWRNISSKSNIHLNLCFYMK